MIKSMTGYGKVHYVDENLNLDIEIKTVNSRYLDVNIRMPNQLNFLEDKIIKNLKTKLKRGRVDIFIRTNGKKLANSKIVVNEDAAIEMVNAITKVSKIAGLGGISREQIRDILGNSDVLSYEQEDLNEEYLENVIISNILKASEKVVEMRINEGENLYEDLKNNIKLLVYNRNKINEYVENIKEELREKIYKSLSEILEDNKIDQDRLANEIVYYADKADINEELSRLDSHFMQFNNTLESDTSVGKKLDFISQELLRETNTIASKSSKIEVTNIAIDMKTIIEKVKEQVQNIE